jgi:hypothetical protein
MRALASIRRRGAAYDQPPTRRTLPQREAALPLTAAALQEMRYRRLSRIAGCIDYLSAVVSSALMKRGDRQFFAGAAAVVAVA